jgi:hypothetical protein
MNKIETTITKPIQTKKATIMCMLKLLCNFPEDEGILSARRTFTISYMIIPGVRIDATLVERYPDQPYACRPD